MLVPSGKAVKMDFARSGGSIVEGRIDVWEATKQGWKSVAVFKFNESTKSSETSTQQIADGSYTCVFKCRVMESVNGLYGYKLDVAKTKKVCEGDGDVNTSSAPDDVKVFRDQFILEVS